MAKNHNFVGSTPTLSTVPIVLAVLARKSVELQGRVRIPLGTLKKELYEFTCEKLEPEKWETIIANLLNG